MGANFIKQRRVRRLISGKALTRKSKRFQGVKTTLNLTDFQIPLVSRRNPETISKDGWIKDLIYHSL